MGALGRCDYNLSKDWAITERSPGHISYMCIAGRSVDRKQSVDTHNSLNAAVALSSVGWMWDGISVVRRFRNVHLIDLIKLKNLINCQYIVCLSRCLEMQRFVRSKLFFLKFRN